MAGRKRKATESANQPNKMWGTSSSSSSYHHHGSTSGGARRRGGSSSSSRKEGGSSSGRASSSAIDEAAALKLFEDISDQEDPNVANMEGISTLCEQLGIDPLEDVRVLVLLWKMGAAKKPAEICKEEWMQGCNNLRVDSIDKFKALLPSLDIGFLDREDFKDFYKFCFQFNRQGTHKTLEKDLVIALLPICLSEGRVPSERLQSFCEFLETTKDESYSKITLDQWRSFLDFCYEVEDLATYDESSSAWPVLIDEYVEFMEKKAKDGKKK
mmetsp:Transcript_11568/g.24402  ORF Transcript_11568/g.24402 Transcript_11568/m.24402 type:complete len:270 (+) Transcript_11568:227-1036(+)